MNTANYTATDSYPLTTEGLDFIQKQILILEQTAAAYGNGNWILQGMTDNSGILSSGVVAIVANGTAEIVEYDGGDPTSALNGKWKIVTTVNSSPTRTVKKLTYDNTNGTITGLSKPYDVSTLRSKFDIINRDIQNLSDKYSETKITYPDPAGLNRDLFIKCAKYGKIVVIAARIPGNLIDDTPRIPVLYRPTSSRVMTVGFNSSYGNFDVSIKEDGSLHSISSATEDTDLTSFNVSFIQL